MATPRKTKCYVRGKPKFRVWLGKRFTGGKARQRYFDSGSEANEFVGEATEARLREGHQAFNLSFEQRFVAFKAFQKLSPYDVSLATAVDTYIAEHCVRVVGKTVDQGAEEFLSSCRRNNLKPRTRTQYESDLSIYSETFGGSQMVGVTREDIEEWLDEQDWAARTRRNKLTTLATFYGFGIDKGYCAISPVAKIKRPKVDDEPVGVLSPEQTERLLRQAEKDRPDLVGALAIATFGSPRRSELCALEWGEVRLADREIEIKASKAKTRQRRIITINDTLARWLSVYAKAEGRVTVTANADVWGGWIRELAKAAGIKEWPKNALRHGFGSHAFALWRDEKRVAAEMGNSPDIVHRHYRAVVAKADCQRFWAIAPAAKDTGGPR